MPSPASTARVNIALALAYTVLGFAGLMLSSPPSVASPIFPAAGLGLAFVLVYGLRALPGVVLGNVLMLLAYAWLNGSINEISLAVTALSALGAGARASAGYWLIRRWQQENWRLMEGERAIILFVVLGGLVSALVSASLCVSGLLLFQEITPAEATYTWWTWYIGDALGIMLFAPLSLCFLLGNEPMWRERRRILVLPALLALGLISAAFQAAIGWEKSRLSDHLNANANLIAARISDRLIKHREIMVSLRNFGESTPALTFDKFQQFTRYWRSTNTDISAFSLNDMVSAQRRTAYEAQGNPLSTLGKFAITERDSQGQAVIAIARPQHGPVRFVVPLIRHQDAVGHDYFSEPMHSQAIERAMDSRSLSMTAPMLPLDKVDKRLVVNAFYPFYSLNDAHNPGWREPIGFFSESIYLDALIEEATRGAIEHGLVIQLRDVTDPLMPTIFYQTDKPKNDFTIFNASEVAWKSTFSVADRQWGLALVTNDIYDGRNRSWVAWQLGATALFIVGLVQMLLLSISGGAAMLKRKNQDIQGALARALLADEVIANSSEAIVITDVIGNVKSINLAFTLMTGYRVEELQGDNLHVLESERQGPEFFQAMWLELSTFRHWKGEIWPRRKNGDVFPAWMTISVIADSRGLVSQYVAAFSDMTEYMNGRDEINFLAFHDVLTGLPNRARSSDLLRKTISAVSHSEKNIAVLFLGLDKFKHVNETHGNATGDALLTQVAYRLASYLSKVDELGRLSGDEFILVLNDIQEPGQVATLCEKIRRHIAEPFNLQYVQLEISVSIGVALYPEHGADHDMLMRHADMALLDAKQNGRNTYSFFHEQMTLNTKNFVETRDALRLALQRDEFELHYQPQIDLKNGRVLGVEALIRWNRPYHGLVMPINFITIAEECGLVVPMGNWVLREACRQAASWSRSEWGQLVVAVNISSMQFLRGNLEKEVLAALTDSGLAPERLELELTESILMDDADSVLATARRLKAHGIKLSIDDFGTGYSSLSYLQRFKVEKLKIDRCFITDLSNDQGNQALVKAIIQMAKSLSLRTIAEGVEDIEIEQKLKSLGCDEAQGYLYAKPLSVAELGQWLNENSLK